MTSRRRDVSLKQIEVFARVYEAASFSAAARNLEVSQPTVSSHIQTLEEALGVELFLRLGRTIRPTTAGERLYTHASRLLQLKDDAVASVRGEGKGLHGDLAIGASNIPGTYLLPAHIARFVRQHPSVHVVMEVGDSRAVTEMVQRGAVSLGFVGAEPDSRHFHVRPFGSDQLLLVTRPDDPMAGKQVKLADLRGRRIVLRERGSGSRRAAENAMADHGLSLVEDLEPSLEVGSNEAAREAVKQGLGVSFVSELSVSNDLKTGQLARIKVRGLSLTRQFHCLWFRKRALSPVAEAFIG